MRAGASVIVTGHHAGDVAEWVLIAMMRGSGIDGIASMSDLRHAANGIALARPLLRESRDVLAEKVRQAGMPVSIDETNAQPRYVRNLVRSFLASVSARGTAPEKTLARSATLMAEDRKLLDTLVRAELDRARSSGARDVLDANTLRSMPPAVLRRVVRMIVRDVPHDGRFSLTHCEAIVRAIREGARRQFHAGKAKVLLSAGMLRVAKRVNRAAMLTTTDRVALLTLLRSGERSHLIGYQHRSAAGASLPVTIYDRWSAPGGKVHSSGRRNPVRSHASLPGGRAESSAPVPLLASTAGSRGREAFESWSRSRYAGDSSVGVT